MAFVATAVNIINYTAEQHEASVNRALNTK